MYVKIKRKRWNGTAFGDCKKDMTGADQLSGAAHNRIMARSYLKTDMRAKGSKSLTVSLKEIKS